jgi:hypothetical protein
MSKYSAANVGFLLVGPYDLRSASDKLEISIANPAVETTPFGVSDAQYERPGVKSFSISGHDGWYDSAATSNAKAMVDLASGEHVFLFAQEGNVMGKRCMAAGGAIKVGFKVNMTQGDFHRASMDLAVSGVLDSALIVTPLASVSGDGNTESTYLDLTAAGVGAAGANVYMSCTALALTGSTNLIVSLEDSTDHITFVPHTAFTALTAVGAEKKVATDMTVNRYLAVKRVFTDLAGTPTATFTVAVKVN